MGVLRINEYDTDQIMFDNLNNYNLKYDGPRSGPASLCEDGRKATMMWASPTRHPGRARMILSFKIQDIILSTLN
jgi:hypothetical protein